MTRKKATAPAHRNCEPHEIALSPSAQSAVTVRAWGKYAGDVDLTKAVEDLRNGTKRVQSGDLAHLEGMLFGQAKALETIFTSLATRSAQNAGEYIEAADKFMRLALKAQAQCRATITALAEIKNPRSVSFVGQANFAHQQQVVNQPQRPNQYAQAPARETETTPNELLTEAPHGIDLDHGTQGQAGRVDQDLATVAAVHRAGHR